MHRQHSLSPYTRHYSHTTNPFLDLLSDPSSSSSSSEEVITVLPKYTGLLLPVLRDYHKAREAGTLLRLTFVTVTDYLFLLRELSRTMQPLGRRGMYYLAAAVSDFYVPSQKTVSGQMSAWPCMPFAHARHAAGAQDSVGQGLIVD